MAAGENPNRDGLRDTPARVARMYAEIFAGLRQRPEDVLTTTFDIAHDELVLVRDIELWSQCEHHLVPFSGEHMLGTSPLTMARSLACRSSRASSTSTQSARRCRSD